MWLNTRKPINISVFPHETRNEKNYLILFMGQKIFTRPQTVHKVDGKILCYKIRDIKYHACISCGLITCVCTYHTISYYMCISCNIMHMSVSCVCTHHYIIHTIIYTHITLFHTCKSHKPITESEQRPASYLMVTLE